MCRDFFADLLVDVAGFVATAGELRKPAAAVAHHVRQRGIGNWIRECRHERGAQVRTDRIRASWHGQLLPDDYHCAVLEYLADEAGSLAPLDSDEQLLCRLTQLAAAEFGGEPADHCAPVAAAMATVERVCRTGRRKIVNDVLVTWWEAYIEIPLGRRPRTNQHPADGQDRGEGMPWSTAPDVAADWTLDDALTERAYGPGGVDDKIAAILGQLPADCLGNAERAEQWVLDSVIGLADEGLLPAAVAQRLLADPERAQAATAAVTAFRQAGMAGVLPFTRRDGRSRPRRPGR